MSKENRLGSLIQPKGSAPRPVEIPQRGEPAPVEVAQPAPVFATPGPAAPKKSLTLKLEEPEYETLREFAHRHRRTHQEVMREAVMRYLQAESKQ
jgi:hypothetical protein